MARVRTALPDAVRQFNPGNRACTGPLIRTTLMRRNQFVNDARRVWVGLALAVLACPLLVSPPVRAVSAELPTVAAHTAQPRPTGSFVPVATAAPTALAATPPQSDQHRITDLMG